MEESGAPVLLPLEVVGVGVAGPVVVLDVAREALEDAGPKAVAPAVGRRVAGTRARP